MNAEIIFNDFAKIAEKDNDYYTFGKHGVIEDTLAWFNIPSEKFIGASSSVHSKNLEKLHHFMVEMATEDQLKVIAKICKDGTVPTFNCADKALGSVFVSMPMNNEKCDCIDEIRNGIQKAIIKTGNKPYFLDKDHHCENIYNVMLQNIHNCKFLIADLTTQNQGVYYEAGYAKALGKTVIFTCRKTDFNERHFDINQIQTISWKEETDLSKQLVDCIYELKLGENQ